MTATDENDSRPSPEQIMTKWLARSTLTRDELQSAAMDCLDFMAEMQERGHELGIRFRGERQFQHVNFLVPGLTTN